MRIALIADAYPPMRTSSAVQLRDLSLEFVRQGHEVTVLIPSAQQKEEWCVDIWHGIHIVRLQSPKTKDIGYIRRTVCEFLTPFAMLRNLEKSPSANFCYDGVICYAPSIFLGPIFNAIKNYSTCRSYLIIRDIFPEWAVDMELMNRGIVYHIFKWIESYLYSVADVIGVQTQANLAYFSNYSTKSKTRIEVLQNWLSKAQVADCSISLKSSQIAGRKIFVYAGNMGVAQGMGILLDLAEKLQGRKDIGFLFVGRGRDAQLLRDEAKARKLDNVLFHEEIDPSEIPGLYAQCHIGLVALDPRHKTHNIPGKFLSYMQSGLPVLAAINPGNDLENLINSERVGLVCTDSSVQTLMHLAEQLVNALTTDIGMSARCKVLSSRLFSPEVAVRQIIAALRG